jgi:hypothetical protein
METALLGQQCLGLLQFHHGHLPRHGRGDGGNVVRFAGDAVLAAWYADPGHSVADLSAGAARCALALQAELRGYRTSEGLPALYSDRHPIRSGPRPRAIIEPGLLHPFLTPGSQTTPEDWEVELIAEVRDGQEQSHTQAKQQGDAFFELIRPLWTFRNLDDNINT